MNIVTARSLLSWRIKMFCFLFWKCIRVCLFNRKLPRRQEKWCEKEELVYVWEIAECVLAGIDQEIMEEEQVSSLPHRCAETTFFINKDVIAWRNSIRYQDASVIRMLCILLPSRTCIILSESAVYEWALLTRSLRIQTWASSFSRNTDTTNGSMDQ